uniref:Uncharacterized protein n=1 Tax=Zea mays TaxID=4577 RepID=C4J1U1_MAIZE|nr:unknown [Zea mays]
MATRITHCGTRAPAAAASSSCTRTASSSGSTIATRASARSVNMHSPSHPCTLIMLRQDFLSRN